MIGFVLLSTLLLLRNFDVSASEPTIELIAGSGTRGCTGDGGQAASASFFQASGSWVDSQGNAYIVDFVCDTVRVVTKSTSIVTTIIGPSGGTTFNDVYAYQATAGTSSHLYKPSGITGDSVANVFYVSDWYHIWKYDIASGIVSRYAGTATQLFATDGDGGQATNATLARASGVFLATDGVLYFCERNGGVVRKIEVNGIISRVAGNSGQLGYAGDGQLATSAAVRIYGPWGCYVNKDGEVYFDDWYVYRVRKVDKNGIINLFLLGEEL
jgi:hypothetical protein